VVSCARGQLVAQTAGSQGACLQVAHLTELAKAAWATRNSEEALALEQAATVAQQEAIITAKAAESSWQGSQATEAEANRLSAAVQVRLLQRHACSTASSKLKILSAVHMVFVPLVCGPHVYCSPFCLNPIAWIIQHCLALIYCSTVSILIRHC
jgi:hypothetical protein